MKDTEGNSTSLMRVIAVKVLKDFWNQSKYSDSENALRSWYLEAKKAKWKTTQDIKNKHRNASFIGDNRVVFNIHGNKYRLVVHINFALSIILVKFIGTHEQYDKIDAEII